MKRLLSTTCQGALLFCVLLLCAGNAPAGMNPDDPGFPRVTLFGQQFDNNHFSATCVACHGRSPGVHLVPLDNTRYGSHFVYGGTSLAATNPAAEKVDAWTDTNGLSRYGNRGTWKSVTGQAGEMICESCHNLRRNTGTYKLLATDNDMIDPSPLCVGCHGATAGYHHPLSDELSSVNNRKMSNADSLFVYRNPPNAATSEVTYPGNDKVNCRSCHKPHRAQTTAGALTLKRGFSAGPVAGSPVQGTGVTGVERKADVGGGRLVTDVTPLCDACHKVNQ